jgi:hypothetical protein
MPAAQSGERPHPRLQPLAAGALGVGLASAAAILHPAQTRVQPPESEVRSPTAPADDTAVLRRSDVWRGHLSRALPWVSLAIGLTSALFMNRGPGRAAFVAIAASVVWFLLLAQQWLARMPMPPHAWHARLLWVGRRSSLMATQSLLQFTLFFALPFFVQAADLHDLGHAGFLVGLCGLSAAMLWDPLSERLLAMRRIGALLPATSSFVALTAVLPGLGLSTRASLWIAAGVAGGGMALMLTAATPAPLRARALRSAVLVALALPLALGLGASRVIPPAPLRLSSIEFGRHLREHWISEPLHNGSASPARLYCATAIASPAGLHDHLFHVWRRNGQPRARVPLEITGGREAGYRTISRIVLGPAESGLFSCRVETGSGQTLGEKSVQLTPAATEPNAT